MNRSWDRHEATTSQGPIFATEGIRRRVKRDSGTRMLAFWSAVLATRPRQPDGQLVWGTTSTMGFTRRVLLDILARAERHFAGPLGEIAIS
jgi:hypothetical protein